MRGEHFGMTAKTAISLGSSPHARGARGLGVGVVGGDRIIPACAGSTGGWLRARKPRGDHPRMRGEHAIRIRVVAPWDGSSPHARGARICHRIARVIGGIIPACAGSTFGFDWYRRSARDHPRMRGEHTMQLKGGLSYEGSSPHARGAHRPHVHLPPHGGIIPACAGSTSNRFAHNLAGRDHPRMRGEHPFIQNDATKRRGSSPHARGAHFTTSASGQHSRLIHSLFASSSHPSGLSSDYIFARRDTCWHCSNPWKAHRQVSRHQCRSVGE